MARDDTYKKVATEAEKPAYANILDQSLDAEDSEILITKKKSERIEPEVVKSVFPINQDSLGVYQESELRRTFVLEPIIVATLDEITNDKTTGKKKKGSKGIIKKIVNNALLKELVEMDLIDKEEIKNLENYKELDRLIKK